MTDPLAMPAGPSLEATIVIAVATVSYLTYHLATGPGPVRALFASARASADALSTTSSWFRRGLGAVLFSAASLALGLSLSLPLGLTLDHLGPSLLWTLATATALAPILWRQSKKPSFQAHYPEVRTPFTNRTRALNALAWLAYLFGYELFFRGLLVLGLAPLIGPFPAVAVSLMGYVFVHLHKYPGEAAGSVFTGLGFSLVALGTGSLVMPILAHLLLALMTDELSSRARAQRSSLEGRVA